MFSKKRILIIENAIDVTGGLKSILSTCVPLSAQFEFIFVIPAHSHTSGEIKQHGFTVIELPIRELNKSLLSVIVYLPYLIINTVRIRRIIRNHNIDLVHVNDLYNLLPVMLRILGSKTPYVCHIRFMPDRFPAWLFNFWVRLHLRFADKIIVVSQSLMNRLPRNEKFELIYNELPLKDRYPHYVKEQTEAGTFRFLYLSNYIRGKGHDFALKAFAKIHLQIPEWTLHFVGGDMGLLKNSAFKEELKALAAELGILEKTTWEGFTEEVELEYKRADIVLNFSESESFSITCLEALYYARPLIASDCGGPADIINPMETGVLVENRNINKMSEAMLQLATNKVLRQTLASRAKESVMEKFSIDKTLYRLRNIYNAVVLEGKQ